MNTPQDFNKFTEILVKIFIFVKNMFLHQNVVIFDNFTSHTECIITWVMFLNLCPQNNCTGMKILKIQDEDSHISKTDTGAGHWSPLLWLS